MKDDLTVRLFGAREENVTSVMRMSSLMAQCGVKLGRGVCLAGGRRLLDVVQDVDVCGSHLGRAFLVSDRTFSIIDVGISDVMKYSTLEPMSERHTEFEISLPSAMTNPSLICHD